MSKNGEKQEGFFPSLLGGPLARKFNPAASHAANQLTPSTPPNWTELLQKSVLDPSLHAQAIGAIRNYVHRYRVRKKEWKS